MSDVERYAPGWPGIPARWASAAKWGVGTCLSPGSRVWFTLSHGILNEVYYPHVDQACTRDMGLVVTNGLDFFSEEKRDTHTELQYPADGVPAYHFINTCIDGRYKIVKDIIADPRRDVILQRARFIPQKGELSDYHVYALTAPHICNRGEANTAWVGHYKSTPMLFAERDGTALAVACDVPWTRASVGFVGVSDGWQDLNRHKLLTWDYTRAENGNVAMTGEIDLAECDGVFVIAIGFGRTWSEAGNRALGSILDNFDGALLAYKREWEGWQKTLPLGEEESIKAHEHNLLRVSSAVLRTHEAKSFPGGLIASLSIPWGFSKGDDDFGGYHLSWPRDLVETAGGLLAVGARGDVRRTLRYLQATQEPSGRWPQNMWLDGCPYWDGIQMDEVGFPILLIGLALREKALNDDDVKRLWPMVRAAAAFIVRNGPMTEQDRWEEDAGFSISTLAVEISALLVAADLADMNGEDEVANYLRETADLWNANIERWTYVTGTKLAEQVRVDGYYIRISALDADISPSVADGMIDVRNRPAPYNRARAGDIISPDALALVRFGLRSADDPRMVNTVKVIDALIKGDTPYGPCWYRYNEDGYGEHEDGGPFDGTGIGRLWPLLTGERAHFELAAGRRDVAENLFRTLAAFANEGGMIPEQVWDKEDVPEKELRLGRPSGSAMPLVWAHSEYLKLHRSLVEGQVFDMPQQPVERYQKAGIGTPFANWRFERKIPAMPVGKRLRVEVFAPASIHWSTDGWKTTHNTATLDSNLGIHIADLPVEKAKAGASVRFTFYWPDSDRWEGKDFCVEIA